MDRSPSRPALPLLLLLLALAACTSRQSEAFSSNCDNPIAAVYTEQCNPYLSRPGRE